MWGPNGAEVAGFVTETRESSPRAVVWMRFLGARVP